VVVFVCAGVEVICDELGGELEFSDLILFDVHSGLNPATLVSKPVKVRIVLHAKYSEPASRICFQA
jgi:hypothetical protein